MTPAPLPASPYRHLHFTGYKTHTPEQTHTPGGPVQLSPPGQPDLGHVMDTVCPPPHDNCCSPRSAEVENNLRRYGTNPSAGSSAHSRTNKQQTNRAETDLCGAFRFMTAHNHDAAAGMQRISAANWRRTRRISALGHYVV